MPERTRAAAPKKNTQSKRRQIVVVVSPAQKKIAEKVGRRHTFTYYMSDEIKQNIHTKRKKKEFDDEDHARADSRVCGQTTTIAQLATTTTTIGKQMNWSRRRRRRGVTKGRKRRRRLRVLKIEKKIEKLQHTHSGTHFCCACVWLCFGALSMASVIIRGGKALRNGVVIFGSVGKFSCGNLVAVVDFIIKFLQSFWTAMV